MFILTSYTSATYKAQIRSSPASGCKQTATASSTESEKSAARAVLAKAYPPKAAETLRLVTDAAEIRELCGDFFKDSKRKQVFNVWTFNPNAR
jgi:hypothetical protein